MATYVYTDGVEFIEREFPIGTAPDAIGFWKRVITAPAIKVSGGTKAGYVRR